MDKKDLFRKKSIDRISSPEQLTDYLKVTDPTLWLVLGAVMVLLAGMLVWACLGRLTTTVTAQAEVRDAKAVMIIPYDEAKDIEKGQSVIIGDEKTVREDKTIDSFGRAVVVAHTSAENGDHETKIITEEISPIDLLLG